MFAQISGYMKGTKYSAVPVRSVKKYSKALRYTACIKGGLKSESAG